MKSITGSFNKNNKNSGNGFFSLILKLGGGGLLAYTLMNAYYLRYMAENIIFIPKDLPLSSLYSFMIIEHFVFLLILLGSLLYFLYFLLPLFGVSRIGIIEFKSSGERKKKTVPSFISLEELIRILSDHYECIKAVYHYEYTEKLEKQGDKIDSFLLEGKSILEEAFILAFVKKFPDEEIITSRSYARFLTTMLEVEKVFKSSIIIFLKDNHIPLEPLALKAYIDTKWKILEARNIRTVRMTYSSTDLPLNDLLDEIKKVSGRNAVYFEVMIHKILDIKKQYLEKIEQEWKGFHDRLLDIFSQKEISVDKKFLEKLKEDTPLAGDKTII